MYEDMINAPVNQGPDVAFSLLTKVRLEIFTVRTQNEFFFLTHHRQNSVELLLIVLIFGTALRIQLLSSLLFAV